MVPTSQCLGRLDKEKIPTSTFKKSQNFAAVIYGWPLIGRIKSLKYVGSNVRSCSIIKSREREGFCFIRASYFSPIVVRYARGGLLRDMIYYVLCSCHCKLCQNWPYIQIYFSSADLYLCGCEIPASWLTLTPRTSFMQPLRVKKKSTTLVLDSTAPFIKVNKFTLLFILTGTSISSVS